MPGDLGLSLVFAGCMVCQTEFRRLLPAEQMTLAKSSLPEPLLPCLWSGVISVDPSQSSGGLSSRFSEGRDAEMAVLVNY